MGLLNNTVLQGQKRPKKILNVSGFGSVQKSPSSPVLMPLEGKATAIFARGTYPQYVSTEKWRERRWRLFSTDPLWDSFICHPSDRSSVIQLRSEDVRPSTAAPIVLEALRKAVKEIAQGVLVTIDPRKNRIRLLPLKKKIP